jgi:hypothetical protein
MWKFITWKYITIKIFCQADHQWLMAVILADQDDLSFFFFYYYCHLFIHSFIYLFYSYVHMMFGSFLPPSLWFESSPANSSQDPILKKKINEKKRLKNKTK